MLPELEEQMVEALNGGGRNQGNFRTALNTFVQILSRRPITKADVASALDRGPPVVMSLSIPAFDVVVTYEHNGDARAFDNEARKTIDQGLAKEAIAELLERIRRGEITLAEEPLPRFEGELVAETPNSQSEGPKSLLNHALQKLLGRLLKKDDRVFEIDREAARATLRLPTMSPPLEVECELPHDSGESESVIKGGVEHELAQMALDELVVYGLLIHDPDVPAVQAYRPAPGAAANVLTPPASPHDEFDPEDAPAPTPPAPRRPPARSAASAAVQLLRKFTDSWQGAAGDEYQEHYTLSRGGGGAMQWEATLMLHIDDGTGPLMEGHGAGVTQEEAKDAAATDLMAQVQEAGVWAPPGGGGGGKPPPFPAGPKKPPVAMFNGRAKGALGGPQQPAARPPPSMMMPSGGKGKGKSY